MICWKKREKFWLPSSEAQINDPKTQTYSVNSHIRQRKAANLHSWAAEVNLNDLYSSKKVKQRSEFQKI